MSTIVMAAGISSRLLPLTSKSPKPMLKVAGKPMIERVINNIVSSGEDNIIITLHYHPEAITNYFKDGSAFNCNITYSYEKELLGTAGSIRKIIVEKNIEDNILVCSGSYLIDNFDFAKLKQFHCLHGGIGTIVLGNAATLNLKDYGQAICDDSDRIIRFHEKPRYNFSSWVHTTYQIYSPSIIEYIPSGRYCALPEDVIPKLVSKGQVYGFKTSCKWHGISTKEAYYKTCKEFESMNKNTIITI